MENNTSIGCVVNVYKHFLTFIEMKSNILSTKQSKDNEENEEWKMDHKFFIFI